VPEVPDSLVAEYVNRIGQNIVRNSDSKTPFTIKVVDSPTINALALPGGFLYINKGLILAADNEAQLAAIMAHLVAHVTAHHAGEAEARNGSNISIFSSPSSAPFLPGLLYSFMRPHEEEADWLGMQYLYKAGYDPTAMASFFEKLTAKDTARQISPSFSTHLQKESRRAKANENIRRYLKAHQKNIGSIADFQDVKARVMQ
jgi:predicted Zn-dependent protease